MSTKRTTRVKKSSSAGSFRSGFEKQFKDYVVKACKDVTLRYEEESLPYVNQYFPDWCGKSAKTGRKIYIETKGYFDAADRHKIKAVIAANKAIDLRLVFMKDNKLRRGSKEFYSDWCTKFGIPYHVVGTGKKLLPDEWVEELGGIVRSKLKQEGKDAEENE